MKVKDVTACNTGESVEYHRMAVGAVRTQAAGRAGFVEMIGQSNCSWASLGGV